MGTSCEKFSLVLLCYNNYKYMYSALQSIFKQDYQNIELIISDDASSFFNIDNLIYYCNSNRGNNIKQIIINENNKTLGTVKHLMIARSKCTGKYIMTLDADDILANDHVISDFVNEFERLGEEAKIITSQCGLYDGKIVNKKGDYLSSDDIQLLKSGTVENIIKEVSYRNIIPELSTCFKTEAIAITEEATTGYVLMDGWPRFNYALKNGLKIHYMDAMTIKHRAGGILQGINTNNAKDYLQYQKDCIKINETSRIYYQSKQDQEMCNKLLMQSDQLLKELEKSRIYSESHKVQDKEISKIEQLKENVGSKILYNDRNRNRMKVMLRDMIYRVTSIKAIKETVFWMLLVCITFNLLMLNQVTGINYLLQVIFNIVFYCLIILTFCQLAINILLKVRRLLSRLRG